MVDSNEILKLIRDRYSFRQILRMYPELTPQGLLDIIEGSLYIPDPKDRVINLLLEVLIEG